MRGLLDTSVLIAGRDDPDKFTLPTDLTEVAVSVVSIAELAVGVLAAADSDQRAARLQALAALERSYDPLPVTSDVAHAYARLVAACKQAGWNPRVMDTLIAATAVVHDCTVVTTDDDFTGLGDVSVHRL